MVIGLQIGYSLALEEEDDRIEDLVVLAEVEDVSELAEVRAVGGHRAKSKLDTIQSSSSPTLNQKVDDVGEHHGPCPATVESKTGIVNENQEAENLGLKTRSLCVIFVCVPLDNIVSCMSYDVIGEGEAEREPRTESGSVDIWWKGFAEELVVVRVSWVWCGQGVPWSGPGRCWV